MKQKRNILLSFSLFFFLTTQAHSRYSNFSWIAGISFLLLCQFGSTHTIVATILEVARFLARFCVHQPPVQTYRPQCFGYHAVSIRWKGWGGKGSCGELFFLSPPIPFTNFTWWKRWLRTQKFCLYCMLCAYHTWPIFEKYGGGIVKKKKTRLFNFDRRCSFWFHFQLKFHRELRVRQSRCHNPENSFLESKNPSNPCIAELR